MTLSLGYFVCVQIFIMLVSHLICTINCTCICAPSLSKKQFTIDGRRGVLVDFLWVRVARVLLMSRCAGDLTSHCAALLLACSSATRIRLPPAAETSSRAMQWRGYRRLSLTPPRLIFVPNSVSPSPTGRSQSPARLLCTVRPMDGWALSQNRGPH
jgi:hypothetical protein